MTEKQQYLFLSSSDSKHIHKNNKWYDFTVEFSDMIDFQGHWECALAEIFFDADVAENLFIYCDICDYSYVGSKLLPTLRLINHKALEFVNLFFIKVNNPEVNRIRIYLRDKNNNIPSLEVTEVNCTLVFKKYIR
jgi:hypothetical protein